MVEKLKKEQKRQRSRKSLQTEQMILTEARRIFGEVGFERATTKEIAQAAQVAEGTLFHHFPSKMALLRGIMVAYYEELQAEAEQIVAAHEDAARRFRALVLNHLRSTEAAWAILRVVGQYGRYGDQAFANAFYQHNKRYTRLFVETIDQLKENLQLRQTVPTPLLRDTLFGSIEHFAIGHFGRERPYNLEAFADQLLDLLIFGSGNRAL